MDSESISKSVSSCFKWATTGFLLATTTGCWVPLRSPAIPASTLPEHFRAPIRSSGEPLNFASLTIRPPADYILGTDDVLEVSVPDLYNGAEFRPMQVRIMSSGEISLPLVGKIRVAGMNVLDAQQAITAAYADGVLQNPRINVALFQKATIDVLVLGEVNQPGVHALPRYQNDVGHAIAAAGGLTQDAAGEIEVHRSPQDALLAPQATLGPGEIIRQGEVISDVTLTDPAERESNTTNEPQDAEEPDMRAAPTEAPEAIEGQRREDDGDSLDSSSSSAPPLPADLPQSHHRRRLPPTNLYQPASHGDDDQLAADGSHLKKVPDGVRIDKSLRLTAYGDESPSLQCMAPCASSDNILRIPLRGMPSEMISEESITLHPGSVVVVPSRKHEVFWVVGRLSNTNLVRFTLGNRERELGAGLVLPRDRDIDVVTAVAMAGYIDPIESPSTVVVHRTRPDGRPLLIGVDLIAARYDRRETVMVEPGDIIYVTPDFPWWFRRTFDRVIPNLITIPYAETVFRMFGTDQR